MRVVGSVPLALVLTGCGPECGVLRYSEGSVRVVLTRAEELVLDVTFDEQTALVAPRREGDFASRLTGIWEAPEPEDIGVPVTEPRLDVRVTWLDTAGAEPDLGLSLVVIDAAKGEDAVVIDADSQDGGSLVPVDETQGTAGALVFVRGAAGEQPLTPNGRLDVAWDFAQGRRERDPEPCDVNRSKAAPP